MKLKSNSSPSKFINYCVVNNYIPVKKTQAYQILNCDKENLRNKWKVKIGRKRLIDVEGLVERVFKILDDNVAMTTSDKKIEQMFDDKQKSLSPRSKARSRIDVKVMSHMMNKYSIQKTPS